MNLVPLGDQAILVYLPNELAAIQFVAAVREANPQWLQDVVPAYASVGVFFDPEAIRTVDVLAWLREAALNPGKSDHLDPGHPRSFHIPVCYALEQDMTRVCAHTGLSPDDIIRLHSGIEYTVHAIGFVPGFPYLGYLPAELSGVGRLHSPRVQVEPGSVGLTGRQTGIYPLPRPGGWNLIGRTPLVIVDVAVGFFPLRVGDRVRFVPIDEPTFRQLQGSRLVPCDTVQVSQDGVPPPAGSLV
jgi:inhibitor of KinA